MAHRRLPLRDILVTIPWVRALPPAARDRVLSDAYERDYDAGAAVAHDGELATSWMGVLDGFLQVSISSASGRMMVLTGIPAGSWVGEGSVIKRDRRRYDVLAMRQSRVVHIPGATFRWLLDTDLEFTHFIMAHLNERLGHFIGMVEIARLVDPTAKMARAIGSLFNPVLSPAIQSQVPLSQTELGVLAGVSRQTANKCVKRLEREGLVSIGYGVIFVRDVVGLKTYPDSDQ